MPEPSQSDGGVGGGGVGGDDDNCGRRRRHFQKGKMYSPAVPRVRALAQPLSTSAAKPETNEQVFWYARAPEPEQS